MSPTGLSGDGTPPRRLDPTPVSIQVTESKLQVLELEGGRTAPRRTSVLGLAQGSPPTPRRAPVVTPSSSPWRTGTVSFGTGGVSTHVRGVVVGGVVVAAEVEVVGEGVAGEGVTDLVSGGVEGPLRLIP